MHKILKRKDLLQLVMSEKPFNLFQKRDNKVQAEGEATRPPTVPHVFKETTPENETNDQYFSYITKDNTYHTAHVLNKIIKTKPENLKYACLVISYVAPDLAQRLLGEFPEDIQVHVVSEMLSLMKQG